MMVFYAQRIEAVSGGWLIHVLLRSFNHYRGCPILDAFIAARVGVTRSGTIH